MSDLHLEVRGRGRSAKDPRFELPVSSADRERLLVLAGDIDVGTHASEFAVRYASAFRAVVLVPGNHEHYKGSVQRLVEKLSAVVCATGVSNVHVLERTSIELGPLSVIGATLWTDYRNGSPSAIDAAERGMRDFRRIRNGPPSAPYAERFRPRDAQALHYKSRAFIETEVMRAHENRKTPVVVTHHAPYYPEGDWGPSISFSYGSDLIDLIERTRPALWIHGHTHESVDMCIAGCRVVSNARGYAGLAEVEGFDAGRVVSVGV